MLKRWIALSAFAVALPIATTASAQYTNNPFTDQTVVLSQALGFEMAAARISVVEAIAPPVDPDMIEVIEQMAKGDFERFGGTLAQLNPTLATNLHDTLSAFEEGMEEGDDMRSLVPQARDLLQQAYDTVIDPSIQAMPAFKAAVLQMLLLDDGGVSEGYEEAVDEIWSYSMGWATWQRAKQLWDDIKGGVTGDQADEGTQLVGILDGLYPQAQPPVPWVGGDPEVAEAPANQLVSIAEAAADADLYPGRELGALATHLADITLPACDAYDAGNDDIGLETMHAVADQYAGEVNGLADLIDLFDPDTAARTSALLARFVVGDDDDDDDAASASASGSAAPAAAASDDDDDSDANADVADMSLGDACRALATQLQTTATTVGE